MRPVGGWLLGRYADRFGRRAALILSVTMMAGGSLVIAVCPGYSSIGALAPTILVLARLVQGLSLGGEYGTSATYLSEVATPRRRGFYSSFQYVTLTGGQLLALGLQLILQQFLTEQQMGSWGWRIAFVVGAIAALTVMWLRRTMDESAQFRNAQAEGSERGTIRLLLQYPREVLTVVGLTLGGTIAFYTFTTYMQKYMINTAGIQKTTVTRINFVALLVFVMDLRLNKVRGQWVVDDVDSTATLLNSNTAPEDPQIAALVRPAHQKVLTYVNGVVGTSLQAMSAATSRYEDTAAMDFVNYVQAGAVRKALAGSANARTPILSIAAPFNKDAAIPAGEVTVRDVAGLYVFDNTLLGITFTGNDVKAYLEKSVEYFKQVSGTGPFTAADVTNAVTGNALNGTPDYNYDIMGGLDARLTYDIDIAQAVGSRIKNLRYAGSPVDPAASFVVAINNYRQSGGGSFPGVTTAPVVYNAQVEIRQLLIDWVTANKVIDPRLFSTTDWRLVSGGAPITITA